MDNVVPIVELLLLVIFVLILLQEAVNGFHDVGNAIATVIYANALKPVPAVVLAAVCNFAGVLVGGAAVAFSLIYLLPVNMIAGINTAHETLLFFALVLSALLWNFGTWLLAIPNSTTHAYIGSILGACMANSYVMSEPIFAEVNWGVTVKVLIALIASPFIGFFLGYVLLMALRHWSKKDLAREELEVPQPAPAERAALIAGSAAVSLMHGTNDGQKSIGLIMLVLFGLAPALFGISLSRLDHQELNELREKVSDVKNVAISIEHKVLEIESGKLLADISRYQSTGLSSEPSRLMTREDFIGVYAQLRKETQSYDELGHLTPENAKVFNDARDFLGRLVEHVPLWVFVLSGLVLGGGTLIGYKRIVKTLGEGMGSVRIGVSQGVAAQASAVASIAMADVGGLPVSTTHVLSSAIVGTVSGTPGNRVNWATLKRMMLTWVTTLPATMLLSFLMGVGLYHLAG